MLVAYISFILVLKQAYEEMAFPACFFHIPAEKECQSSWHSRVLDGKWWSVAAELRQEWWAVHSPGGAFRLRHIK